MKTEIKRQIIHILLGVLYLAILNYFPKEQSLIAILFIFSIGSFISFSHRHLKPLPFVKDVIHLVQREREKEIPGRAALSFTLGVLMAIIVFYPFNPLVAIGAVCVLTFGDGFSTLVGKLFGKRKIFDGKTLEGTIGGIIASTASLYYFFPFEIALATSLIAMIAEYLPINDNYTIPIAAGLILLVLV